MSFEQDIIPTPSGDPFYDALIKRLYIEDDRTKYYDALYFRGSTRQVEDFVLTDYLVMGLKEAPPIHERNAQSRRALLARGLGCLSLELKVMDEPNKPSYLVTRPADLADPPFMFNIQYVCGHYPDLAGYDLQEPRVFRFLPTADEAIIDDPLNHPYLGEVYDEIVGTF
ncbi:MAG TPA: hypothetical protein VLG16_03965 [Candidatus Saccharimonadales bacterium]|nr:hypothetical protein [Candidatus Saccharimonadales bacterium]